MMPRDSSGFENAYWQESFWNNLVDFARNAGRDVVEKALQLFFAAQSPDTPLWAKIVIYSALGYFINIVDAIPDFTPAVGYGDDLGVLVAALATVAAHVSPEIKARASAKALDWFGPHRCAQDAADT